MTYTQPIGHGGQGVFTCPGGYDDDAYVRCGYRSSKETRPPWVVTEHELAPPRKSGGKPAAPPAAASAAPAAASIIVD